MNKRSISKVIPFVRDDVDGDYRFDSGDLSLHLMWATDKGRKVWGVSAYKGGEDLLPRATWGTQRRALEIAERVYSEHVSK